MSFTNTILDKWNLEQISTINPSSDSYGFEAVHSGNNYRNHPFKIFLISNDAPVVIRDDYKDIPITEKREFAFKIAVNKGSVYDLSRYDANTVNPLCISRRRDGRYLAMKFNNREFLTPEQLKKMEVLPTIGEEKMITVVPKVDFGPPITLQIKTNGNYVDSIDVGNGGGSLFLEIKLQDNPPIAENWAYRINGCSFLTKDQIKKKYGGATIFTEDRVTIPNELRNTQVKFLKVYNPINCAYTCINGPLTSFKPGITTASYSEELKKFLKGEAARGKYYFVFQPRPDLNETRILKDNLFLRYY